MQGRNYYLREKQSCVQRIQTILPLVGVCLKKARLLLNIGFEIEILSPTQVWNETLEYRTQIVMPTAKRQMSVIESTRCCNLVLQDVKSAKVKYHK